MVVLSFTERGGGDAPSPAGEACCNPRAVQVPRLQGLQGALMPSPRPRHVEADLAVRDITRHHPPAVFFPPPCRLIVVPISYRAHQSVLNLGPPPSCFAPFSLRWAQVRAHLVPPVPPPHQAESVQDGAPIPRRLSELTEDPQRYALFQL